MKAPDKSKDWQKSNADVFWGEIAPCNHLIQIYENDEVVLDSIEGFVSNGLKIGDSVIIIATEMHLNALDARLRAVGFDIDALRLTNQFIPLDAEETLSKFMVNGWPDEILFMKVVNNVVLRAKGKNNRKVRAYGEMVAILWAKGHSGATVRLERLWNLLCKTEGFCLFCAYPKSGFTQDADKSIADICSAHTELIAGDVSSVLEVFYKTA